MSDKEQGNHKERKSHGGHGRHEEGHEGAPEWLISFADNTALMMGFFVILLAFNMGPKGGGAEGSGAPTEGKAEPPADFLDTAIGIREAFHNPVNLNSMDPNDQLLIRRILERRGLAAVEEDGPPGDSHKVQSIRPSNYFGLCGKVPFDDKSSDLSVAGRQAALDLASRLRGLRLIVDVRGHVSAAEAFNTPDRGLRLSFERAMSVANLLSENGVDRKLLRLVACGDIERVKPPTYDWQGHAAHRRVEVVLTEEVLPDNTPGAELSAPPPGENPPKPQH